MMQIHLIKSFHALIENESKEEALLCVQCANGLIKNALLGRVAMNTNGLVTSSSNQCNHKRVGFDFVQP